MVMSALLVIGLTVALFFILMGYMAIGLTTGSYEANVFLVSTLVLVAALAAGTRWAWRVLNKAPVTTATETERAPEE